ncbi:MAG: ribosomal protein S18-alanine N-acetyltransferase [Dehalococcoidales bacterium]|nr:ribosomal protein S18-alanine N-acetyltransferase [Dehalococcoidales bacterium]
MQYVLRPMRVDDVDEVIEIEHESFSLSWPASAYRREIRDNRMARYLVIERADAMRRVPIPESRPPQEGTVRRLLRSFLKTGDGKRPPLEVTIVGYAGLWLMVDEAHITTIAVRPEYRGQGLGELLMVGLIDTAMELDARWVTLEVRASNTVAQNLYKKYTFHGEGVRKGYYSDNHEDALIMWSEEIRTPAFKEKFKVLKGNLERRLQEEN